jgi:hypothetical protein
MACDHIIDSRKNRIDDSFCESDFDDSLIIHSLLAEFNYICSGREMISFKKKLNEFGMSDNLKLQFMKTSNIYYVAYKFLIKSLLKKIPPVDRSEKYIKIEEVVAEIVFSYSKDYPDGKIKYLKKMEKKMEEEYKYVLQKEQLHKELIEKFWAPSKYDIWWNEDMG